ncbi:MAG: SDR family oxidoreductase [Planctomycetes bacterium]|nr:SDR family oxidoreductase [Planctomycetota bacterium]
MTLKDKVVVVTGGGRGIGRAIVVAFAEQGATLAVCARTMTEIEEVAAEARKLGVEAIAVPLDVTDESSASNMVQTVEDQLGPIDILINNAGVALFKPFLETTAEEWDRMMDINAKGVFLCCRAVLPGMIQRKYGRIINVSSSAGKKGYPEQSAYCASKHAIQGLSKVLALETQKHGIRIHVICPGGVDTELVRQGRDDVDLSKYMRPEEIADVAVFLASQDATAMIDEITVRRIEAGPWSC